MKEFQEIINKDTPSVFDFWADWCGSCKAMTPKYEHLAEETDGPDFYRLNVNRVPDAAEEVGISAMPTFVSFKGGAKMDELIGAQPEKLRKLVQTAATL